MTIIKPQVWKKTVIGEVAKVSSGGTPDRSRPDYWGGDIPWISTGKINGGTIEEAEEFITEEGLENSSTRIYKKGTLLMAMYGQGQTRGRVAVLGFDATTNQACATIEPGDKIERDYLFQYLKANYYTIRQWSQGGNQANLNGELIKSFPILLPPLPEQRAIAAILTTWDRAIAQMTRLIAAKRRLKQGLMQQLLTGKVRFTRKNSIQIWQKHTLKDLGVTFGGLTGKCKDDFGKGKPYIPYMNVFTYSRINPNDLGFVSIMNNERQNTVKLGDIIFTTSSETPDEVGMSSVLLDDLGEVYLNSFCFGFRLHNSETILPEYARFLFRGVLFRLQLAKLAQGATRFNLSKTRVLDIQVYLPPIVEQKRIALVLEECENELTMLNGNKDAFQIQKKALMQKLLTGQVRVGVINGETTNAL